MRICLIFFLEISQKTLSKILIYFLIFLLLWKKLREPRIRELPKYLYFSWARTYPIVVNLLPLEFTLTSSVIVALQFRSQEPAFTLLEYSKIEILRIATIWIMRRRLLTILCMRWYLMNSLVLKNIMWFPLFVVPVVAVQGRTTKNPPWTDHAQ